MGVNLLWNRGVNMYVISKKGKLWVEPLKNWIESAHTAEKLGFSKDFCFEKSLLEKIGTNRILKDKKLRFDFAPPFSFVSKYKGMAGEWRDKNKKGDEVVFTSSPAWWAHQDLNLGPPDYESGALTN